MNDLENMVEIRNHVVRQKQPFRGIILAALLCLILPVCLAESPGNVKKGERVFASMQCAICHTNGGNNLNPDKPLKGPGFLKKYPSNQLLTKTIRSGIANRGMPSFGKDKLNDADLQDLLAYIRSLTPAKCK